MMYNKNTILALYIVFVVVLSPLILTVSATQTHELTIPPLNTSGAKWTLSSGDSLSGSVQITHGVKFWITDPDGYIIKDYGKITQTTSFEFLAAKQGGYSLKFQSLSFEDTTVQISYNRVTQNYFTDFDQTSESVLGYTRLFTSIIILVITILFLVGAVKVVGYFRKRNRKPPLSPLK